MLKDRLEKGYSLLEALVVVALIGIVLAIAIAAFGQFLQDYRITVVARRLGSAISLARLKSVSSNMTYTFNLDAGNLYQISGTNDLNLSGSLDPWEDVFGDGTIHTDTVYSTRQELEKAIVDHQGFVGNTLPNAADVTLAMDAGTVLNIVFNGSGVVTSMNDGTDNKNYILLQSGTLTRAIFVESTGVVRVFKYDSGGWLELS